MPTIICDLDGVVYLGDQEIAGSGEALVRLGAAGWNVVFCTNNSTRTPEESAAKIVRLTGYPATADQVVTSGLAAATLLEWGAVVFVLGGNGLVRAVEDRGGIVTDDWRSADTVLIGLDPALTYERLSSAVLAVANGARFVASNHDPTYPAPDGLRPGAGSLVAAVAHATGRAAIFAGKPHQPMRDLLASKTLPGEVWIVGDRDDTDLAMGRAAGWKTAHVGTGVPEEPGEPPSLSARDLAQVADYLLPE